ncbi:hypothetical protein ABK040_001407 [Willaertia magna]
MSKTTIEKFKFIEYNLQQLNNLCPFYLYSKDKKLIGFVKKYTNNKKDFEKVLKKNNEMIKKVPIEIKIVPFIKVNKYTTPTAFAKAVTKGINGNFREVCFIHDTVDGKFKKMDELQCLDVLRGKTKFSSTIVPEKMEDDEDSSSDYTSDEGSDSDKDDAISIRSRKRRNDLRSSPQKKKEKKTDNVGVLQEGNSNITDSNPLLSQNNNITTSNSSVVTTSVENSSLLLTSTLITVPTTTLETNEDSNNNIDNATEELIRMIKAKAVEARMDSKMLSVICDRIVEEEYNLYTLRLIGEDEFESYMKKTGVVTKGAWIILLKHVVFD